MDINVFLGTTLLALAVIFCLSLLISHFLTGVPALSANSLERANVVSLLGKTGFDRSGTIYDLGCGWGAQIIALAGAFPDVPICGIEISPFPYWVTKWRVRHLANVEIRRGDFFKSDLENAAAVTCYLIPSAMPKVAGFLDTILKPDTPVVALSFWFRDRQASDRSSESGLLRAAALYRWPAKR